MPTDPVHVARLWAADAVPSLEAYIRIPNQSPAFDPDWAAGGLIHEACRHVADWCRLHGPEGLTVEIVELDGRTPLLLMEIDAHPGNGVTPTGPGAGADTPTVLCYGHLDKQPPMDGWDEGLGPYTPVVRDGRLFGRGGADDGYAAYATVTALRALRDGGAAHPRCVVLIEASEESGSPDLVAYLDHLSERIGTPDLVVCLDSGCGDYDHLWVTTSLRGLTSGILHVDVLEEGVHSGDGGGVVPDSFRLARLLLDRVENAATGEVLVPAARVEVPPHRHHEAAVAAAVLGRLVLDRFPWVHGPESTTPGPTPGAEGDADPAVPDPQHLTEAVLSRTWRASLAVHGADGLPPVAQAGNVLRPGTDLRLSVRTPPGADADEVAAQLAEALTTDPPSGAVVRFEAEAVGPGWDAPTLAPWLATALEACAQAHFDRQACFMGEGGTIPFMAMLGERFPQAQFLVTGVLGPQANAHGPNEFLHLDYARHLVSCVADVLEAAALALG